MTSHDERSEQTQRNWLTLLARERLDLSASVEATLLDEMGQGPQEQDEADEQEGAVRTSQEGALIPPRLSLRSKMMPAVREGSFVEGASQAQGIPDGGQAPDPSVQNTGVLARFAQRLTSSLAVFGGARRSGMASHPGSLWGEEQRTLPLSQEAPTLIRQREKHMPVTGSDKTGVVESGTAPSYPGAPGTQAVPGKHKLGGRATRVHLETAPKSAVTGEEPPSVKLVQEKKKEWQATTSDMQSLDIPYSPVKQGRNPISMLDIYRLDVGSASAALPAPLEAASTNTTLPGQSDAAGGNRALPAQLDAVSTSTTLPGLLDAGSANSDVEEQKVETKTDGPAKSSGSGIIEVGQCDITLENTCVTETSVVQVMLTSDPGPVVVQYVSLQPRQGFTMHLTAPAARRTSFNYVIL